MPSDALKGQVDELEELAYAVYMDMKTPRTFEAWRRLWRLRDVEVPEGAWT